MSIWNSLRGLIDKERSAYVVVWRELAAHQTLMKAESIPAESDVEAVALARSRFSNAGDDWVFWALFRPDDEFLSSQAGPQIAKWHYSIQQIAIDSHVQNTLRAYRKCGKPITRPLRKVMLKAHGPILGVEED